MSVFRTHVARAALVTLAVMLLGSIHGHAQSGTLLSQTATLLNPATASIDFDVATGKSAGSTTKIFLEIGAEGNSASPPPDPSLPATLRFKVSKTGVATPSEFTTMGGADNTTFANKVVVLTKGAENQADPRGLYVLAVAHVTGTSAAESWKVEITNLPANLRVVASIDQGVFKAMTPTGPCTGGTCPPCPGCPNTCPPGHSCWPLHVFPYWKYAEVVVFPKWPPGPQCLSCPRPWEVPKPEGFDRVFVALTPYLSENAPLGPGKAESIKVSITGGEAVGPVFDTGTGQYLQLVQHKSGQSPRVRASVGDVTSEEVVVGASGGVDPIFKTLTYILAALLIVALIVIFSSRRGGAVARG